MSDEFLNLAREKSTMALHRLVEILDMPDCKPETTIKVCQTIIEYGYGKPRQPCDKTSEKDIEVKVVYE